VAKKGELRVAVAYCLSQSYAAASIPPLPLRFHGEISIPDMATKKPSKRERFQGLDLVAGAGFEPAAFRL
jgi:hypothetical protein